MNQHQISTSFPFGFVKRAVVRGRRQTIVVLPALARVNARILTLFHSAEKSGSRVRPRRGGHDEFYGVKEYRTGENPRMIHWKRTARTGTLVMREMTEVAPPRILLVLDTHPANASAAAIERAIAMAASLASFAIDRGHPVGLIAWSGAMMEIRPQRGKQHRRDMLTALAQLSSNPDQVLDRLLETALPSASMGTTIVVITPKRLVGVEQQGRIVFLSSSAEEHGTWFTFPENVDFEHCMPLDQEASALAAGLLKEAAHV